VAEPQLSVRSAKARDPARREHRSIADVVERALEAYEIREAAVLARDIVSIALRQGRPMTASDGMIAAIVRINGGRLATRNLPDFETTGLELICPWDF